MQNYRCPSTLEKTRKREQKDRKLVFGHYAERQGFRQSQNSHERLKPGRNGSQNANCYGVKRGSYGNLPPRRTVEIRRFLDNLAFFKDSKMQIPINQRKRVKGKSFFSLFGTDHPPTALGRAPENAPNFKAEYVR